LSHFQEKNESKADNVNQITKFNLTFKFANDIFAVFKIEPAGHLFERSLRFLK